MASDTVFTAVKTYLTANFSACPLTWENDAYQPASPPAPWMLIQFEGDLFEQITIGAGTPAANLWREQGAVLAHGFVPSGTGSLLARQNLVAMATLLRGLELTPAIRFRAMSIGDYGAGSEDGNYWGLSLRADFIRD